MDSNEIQAIYRDEFGVEAVTLQWDGDGRFLTRIRGVEFEVDQFFYAIEPASADAAKEKRFRLDDQGYLRGCRLTICFPLRSTSPKSSEIIVYSEFSDDFERREWVKLRFELWIDGVIVAIESDWTVEDGGLRLFKRIASEARPECCLTCAFSDYPPGYNDPFYCFRDVGEKYVRVRGRSELIRFMEKHPSAEIVYELYVCDQFQLRTLGRGYRG
jgi:hypothetical protein